ncbi:solute carrier family 41 member 1 [Nephila pilipes]|uniref:Solute carrier family 41 member 1 n=1 Tax=Nephila pilipes TaxID=299642 RepID=A0A8X6Q6S2_NEPPI|nr:solute carrier family 41 member 1 [Nephila pilipes]
MQIINKNSRFLFLLHLLLSHQLAIVKLNHGWTVFQNVTELFILVPTLLGLKGNLEMTLASRVSTQANLGNLDSMKQKWQMSWGNMALIQCQATVMGFLAAAFATTMSIANNGFSLSNALLLCASSLFTAVLASLILGSITLAVVILSHKFNINPDNVATPIAASLGDVTTLGILAAISSYLYKIKENYIPPSIIIGIFIFLIPVWIYLSYKNPFVRQVLYSGWIPVIMALIITSAGGYILEFSVSQFKGFAIFQPVINGVAGNLVAVQASRISTYFHQMSEKPGTRPPDGSPICISPFYAFFGKYCFVALHRPMPHSNIVAIENRSRQFSHSSTYRSRRFKRHDLSHDSFLHSSCCNIVSSSMSFS